MIAAITSNTKFNNVIVSTGNILNVNNQLGGKSSEELLDGLRLTLQCAEAAKQVELNEADGLVLRATQELHQKLTENARSEINIGAKIFVNKISSACIEQAVNALLQILKVQHVDNVVLAYHPQQPTDATKHNDTNNSVAPLTEIDGAETEGELRRLWTGLELFAQRKQVAQLGIADLDLEQLKQLHTAADVPPTIMQINLVSCCVVPTALKEFCTKHDIQLLTHNDPEVLLADEEFIVPDYQVDWTLRYQVHLRCRGVLTAKGYILGASKKETNAAV